jgi:hypothetical protein
MAEDLKMAVLLEQSMERAALRQNGCSMCGVKEEEDVLCGKAVAAMCPTHDKILDFIHVSGHELHVMW